MKRTDIRLANARRLMDEAGGLTQFADRVGMTVSQAGQIIGKTPTRGIGNVIAPRIEEAFGKPSGWLDQPPSEAPDVFSASGAVSPLAQLPTAERELLDDYRLLLEEDQQRLATEVKRLADIARAYQSRFGDKTADNKRVTEHLPPAMTDERARSLLSDPRVQALLKEIEEKR